MVNTRKIIWDDEAAKSLRSAIKYIRIDSPQNAEKVKIVIKAVVKELAAKPERYPKDKYKANNNGEYRAFEIYSYRIAYFISDNEIRIIRVRHTSQEPLDY